MTSCSTWNLKTKTNSKHHLSGFTETGMQKYLSNNSGLSAPLKSACLAQGPVQSQQKKEGGREGSELSKLSLRFFTTGTHNQQIHSMGRLQNHPSLKDSRGEFISDCLAT